MRDVTNRKFFLSAHQAAESEAMNQHNHIQALKVLKDSGIPAMEIDGCYNGVPEKSILVVGDNNVEKHVLALAALFNQESILTVYWDGVGIVSRVSDGAAMSKGRLEQVTKEEAEKNKSYSVIDNRHYILK